MWFFFPLFSPLGFVDIFSKTKERLGAHASKILKFLHRNRIPSSALPFPILEGYNSICTMRSSVVQDYLQLLLQKEKGEPLLIVQIPSRPFKQNKNVLSSTIHSSVHVSLSDLDIQYGELDLDPEVEKVKVLTQCYSSIEVSSNVADIFKMTNGETSSFWQSDGSARSHWIRYGHPVLKYNIAADCHTCWSTCLNMLDNTEAMLRPACSLCCPQIKDET